MSGQHTPGPWGWFGNAKTNEVYLATKHSGRRYVMGFQRWGMRGAQPMFQPGERGLVPADTLLTFEVGDRAVRGAEAAKADESVYRYDISGIDCADARLIAAAPQLLEALEWMVANDDTNEGDQPLEELGGQSWDEYNAYWIEGLNRARAAIAAATGGAA